MKKTAILLLFLYVFLNPLYAASENLLSGGNGMWSVKIGAGKSFSNSSYKDATTDTNSCESGIIACDIDDSDTTFHIGVERLLNDYLSIGLQYERLGDIYYVNSATSAEKLKQNTSVISVNLMASYDISANFSPFAEIGAGHYRSKAKYSSATTRLSDSSSGISALFGLGMKYKYDSNWGMHIGWRKYQKTGEKQRMLGSGAPVPTYIKTLDAKVESTYISLSYTF